MSTERIDVEALRERAHFLQIMSHSTVLEPIANEYAALLAEVIERRARDAAVAELVAAATALVGPPLRYHNATIEVDCSDHSTAMRVVARVRNAIAAIQGAQP